MTYPTIFGNLTAGNQPASLFDTMFNIAGQQGAIPTTASGTNAISLTSQTNNYVGTSYTDGQLVSWQAAATSTGSVTMQWSGLGFVNYYNASGIQAGSGDIVSGNNYLSQYRANLNSGNGGFITINSTLSNVSSPVQGTFKNLSISVGTNTQVTPTADAIIVQNSSNGTVRILSFAPGACNIATNGANGLDTGSVAASTWYAMFAIYNATTATAASLLSASFTSPTLPSGYTYSARIGAFVTDGSTNLLRISQKGNRAQYVLATNPTSTVIAAHGTAGTFSTTAPTLVAVSLVSFIPPTAREIFLLANTSYAANAVASVEVAPNTSWGGANNGPAGSNGNIYPVWMTGATLGQSVLVSLLVETSTTAGVAWATQAAGGAIGILGWIDQLP